MTTLHRKPRGASEQSASVSGATSYYTTIDILPSLSASSAKNASGVNSTSSGSHQSSKTRRHGGGKYVRRSGLFGGGSGSPSSSSTAQSKKMSTTQLRAFFAACVLVYLSALYFAEDIVKFGKAVNSDATRQKIFSQWRPMHSAAKQYLRSIVDTANGGRDGAVVVNATVASEPETPAAVAKKQEEMESRNPQPSMNSEREPPTAPDIATVPAEQVALLSEEPHAAQQHQEANPEPETEANRPAAIQEKRPDPPVQVEQLSDAHPDGVPTVEIKEELPQHEVVVNENNKFDPALSENRMEDPVVIDEHQKPLKASEVMQDNEAPQESYSPSAAVAPSFLKADDAEKELALPASTLVAVVSVDPATAVSIVAQPTATAAVEGGPVATAENNNYVAPPLSDDDTAAANDDGEDGETQQTASSRAPVETLAEVGEENIETEETTESRHPGRDET